MIMEHDRFPRLAEVCADDGEALALSITRFIAAAYMTADAACWDAAHYGDKKISSEEETWSDRSLLIYRHNLISIDSRPFASELAKRNAQAAEAVVAAYDTARAVVDRSMARTRAARPTAGLGSRTARRSRVPPTATATRSAKLPTFSSCGRDLSSPEPLTGAPHPSCRRALNPGLMRNPTMTFPEMLRRVPRSEWLLFVALLAFMLVGTMTVRSEPIALMDLEGRAVTLPKAAERVVSIPIPLASTLIAMDQGTKRLVGMNAIAKSAILEGILGRIFPASRDIRSDIVGQNFMPNIENLAAARPDLVLQWGGRGDDIVKPLTNAGLPVALILCCKEVWTRSYHDLLAGAIGRPERATENTAWRDRVMAQITAKAGAIAPERKPRVLFVTRALDQLQVSGSDAYGGWMIELAGGVNVTGGDYYIPVNAEQIAAWNPDVILLNSFEDMLDTGFVLKHPILSLTNAAQTSRVYKMPLGGYRWDPPSHESPLTWMWLANLLHPEHYSFDLRAAMREVYQTLYGHRLIDADIDEILRIGMQGSAAHYAQFRAK